MSTGQPLWFRVIDWLFVLLACRVLGQHMWIHRELLYVPFYGYGHQQCQDCGLIRVRP